MVRRLALAFAVLLVAALSLLSPVSAQTAPGSSTTGPSLPGTTLEAQQRDDGSTSQAPALIASGLAAAAAIGVGGLLLQRRQG